MRISFINEWLTSDFTRAFAWTLIHSLWQGLVAALVAALIILFTKKSTAGLRYYLFSAVFLLFLLTSFFTFFSKYNSYNTSVAEISQNQVQVKEQSVNVSASTKTLEPGFSLINDFTSYFDQNAPLVVMVWFIVFVVQCLKLISGFYYIQNIRRRQVSAVPGEWKEKLDTFCCTLGITRTVIFMQSGLVKMPVVLGYLKPVVLVPVGIFARLPAEQVETILLHELAHIRREDYLVNMLQSFAETLFFFNPAIKWISGIIREEREACCDDIVVANTTNKTTYLEALVNFNDHSLLKGGYAMALGGNQTCLLNRVKRMLTYENNKLNVMEKLFLISGCVVFTAFNMINTKEADVLSAPFVLASKIIEQPFVTKQPAENTVVLSTSNEVKAPEDKQVNIATALAAKVDTLPTSRTTYTHVYSNTNSDGNTKTTDATFKDESGKSYRIKRVNDKVTELYVNDVRVSESEMAGYKNILEDLDEVMKLVAERAEEARQRGEEARIRGEEARKRGEEARLRGEEARKRGEDAIKRGEEARKQGEDAVKRGEEARQRGEEAMKRGEEARVRGEEARKRGEEARVRGEEARVRGEETRKMISEIVDELIKEKVISSADNLTFTLSNNTLTVNGVAQSAALHSKLKKFIKGQGDTITYSKDGNTTSSSINRHQ
jgi:beta-lactamase regulating signal transducer with metallopeptidase domain